jgi:general stress protein 26
MSIDLTGYADAIDHALADGTYCVLATNGENGVPELGFKGSMIVFDRDHLAYWERGRGQLLANLRRNPDVAVMYFNHERSIYLRMYGRAELHEDGPVREQIMERAPEFELNMDPERQGVGVLIRLDRLREAIGGVSQQRSTTEVA